MMRSIPPSLRSGIKMCDASNWRYEDSLYRVRNTRIANATIAKDAKRSISGDGNKKNETYVVSAVIGARINSSSVNVTKRTNTKDAKHADSTSSIIVIKLSDERERIR